LIVGCGSSNLGARLYDRGFKHIQSMDVSSVAIERMRREHSATRPEMQWWTGSCTDMRAQVASDSIDVVLDKGTADTLQFRAKSRTAAALLQAMLHEVHRVLSPRGGRYFCITPRKRMAALVQPDLHWAVTKIRVPVDGEARCTHKETVLAAQQQREPTNGAVTAVSNAVAKEGTNDVRSSYDSASVEGAAAESDVGAAAAAAPAAAANASSSEPKPRRQQQQQQPLPEHEMHNDAYVHLCIKHDASATAALPSSDSNSGGRAAAINVPKHVQEAQILLRRVQQQQQQLQQERYASSALVGAASSAAAAAVTPSELSPSSLSATVPVLTRAQLKPSMLSALSAQPSLAPGSHTGVSHPQETLVCFDARIECKRKLSARFIIYSVQVIDNDEQSAKESSSAEATSSFAAAAAAATAAAATEPGTPHAAHPAHPSLDLDKLQVMATAELVEDDSGSASNVASSAGAAAPAIAKCPSAFASLHSLFRRGDLVRVWGWAGTNRAASEHVVFVRRMELTQVNQHRLEQLQQRATYHGLNQG
jgi:ubiquinone/menaquinone biosynthesis C-methylase UbiE